MASPFLQFPKLSALSIAGGFASNPQLSQLSSVFLLSACVFLQERYIWQNPNYPISDSEYQDILDMLAQTQFELMRSFVVGQIIESICTLTIDNLLLLDGSIVAVSDYPELVDCVPSSWIVGSDIQLPNMSQTGLFGTDSPVNVGDIVGSNSHQLTIAEMPSHTHTQNPHVHSELIPAVTPTGAGPIVAGASVVIPSPSTTGFTTATNNNSGGDGSHNNIQQSLNIFFYIVGF